MLRKIDNILTAEALGALRAMGHGDTLVLCDANFPADSVAASTIVGKPIRTNADTCARLARAIADLMPVDTFVPAPLLRMENVGSPQLVPEVQAEVLEAVREVQPDCPDFGSCERIAFYEQARRAFAVISTLERRFYGCFIMTKGVIGPDEETGRP